MVVTSKTLNQIDYDLYFSKPFKSTGKVWFIFSEIDNTAHVVWGLKAELPFFLFFMKKMMFAYMGADYQRGLL